MSRFDEEALSGRWYVHADDLIGGWAVMNVDKPPSQCDARAGEGEIASFVSEAVARHIADLHHAWLDSNR